MARIDKGLVLKLPADMLQAVHLAEGDEVEFELVGNSMIGIKKAEELSSGERAVLEKLGKIKFADRNRENVRNALDESEYKVLGGLMKRGAVSFYEGGKYKEKGVYSISRNFYYYLTKPAEKSGEKRCGIVKKCMGNKSHMVVKDFNQAKDVLTQLEPEIASGKIVVVRGFDKAFYIVAQEAVSDVGSCLFAALEVGDMTLDELGDKCGVERELCKSVLEVLRESGDIIEKKKELYSLA